jgi:hypothetical protein
MDLEDSICSIRAKRYLSRRDFYTYTVALSWPVVNHHFPSQEITLLTSIFDRWATSRQLPAGASTSGSVLPVLVSLLTHRKAFH